VYCLADERAVQTGVWIVGADLEGLAADVTGHAGRVAEPKALIDFRIDPSFSALPEPHTDKKRGIPGLSALIRDETVRPDIGCVKGRSVLLDVGGLSMYGPIVDGWRVADKSLGIIERPVVQAEPDLLQCKI